MRNLKHSNLTNFNGWWDNLLVAQQGIYNIHNPFNLPIGLSLLLLYFVFHWKFITVLNHQSFHHWRERGLLWKALFVPGQSISELSTIPHPCSHNWERCLERNYNRIICTVLLYGCKCTTYMATHTDILVYKSISLYLHIFRSSDFPVVMWCRWFVSYGFVVIEVQF